MADCGIPLSAGVTEGHPELLEGRSVMSSASKHSGRSAAVTGAGGGLGRDIALGLAAKGYVVFGTAVSPAEVEDLKKVSGGRVINRLLQQNRPIREADILRLRTRVGFREWPAGRRTRWAVVL
jgi:nucleoside-diphosphate-sugar epimerase